MGALCPHKLWEHHPVINIPVTGDFPAITAIVLYNLWKVVVYGIEFKPVVLAPFNSDGECLSDSAGPENELIAIGLPFLKVIDKRLIGFATVRPFTETKGAVKVNGDDLIIAFHGGLLSLVVLFVQVREEYWKGYFKIICQAVCHLYGRIMRTVFNCSGHV